MKVLFNQNFRNLIKGLLHYIRRGMEVHQSGGVVEAAPVPDLLGSILSGQSMLLMDSSDVVINRDGSLKNTKPSKCMCHIFGEQIETLTIKWMYFAAVCSVSLHILLNTAKLTKKGVRRIVCW